MVSDIIWPQPAFLPLPYIFLLSIHSTPATLGFLLFLHHATVMLTLELLPLLFLLPGTLFCRSLHNQPLIILILLKCHLFILSILSQFVPLFPSHSLYPLIYFISFSLPKTIWNVYTCTCLVSCLSHQNSIKSGAWHVLPMCLRPQ